MLEAESRLAAEDEIVTSTPYLSIQWNSNVGQLTWEEAGEAGY